ncbi:MAG: hypothetical protein Q8Q62_14520, partial [Mesorhizobium sp.]|nr:hypothetical protein [Mesorhizobium sp.]
MNPRIRHLALAGFAAAFVSGVSLALAQSDFGFMPDGGRQTLLRLFDASPADLTAVISSKHSEAEWVTALAPNAATLKPEEIETLASYLAVNMPLPRAQGMTAPGLEQMAELLPPDGKELAIANCQFCHSFFTGYLVHDRDAEGWRSVFKSPFHKELAMTEKERETFARYSAI